MFFLSYSKSFSLPDIFGVTVKMEDGYKLGGVSRVLKVVNGIVQVSLPLVVKVDESRRTCDDTTPGIENISV